MFLSLFDMIKLVFFQVKECKCIYKSAYLHASIKILRKAHARYTWACKETKN